MASVTQTYFQKGLGLKAEVLPVLERSYKSDAVEALFAALVLRNGKTPTMDLDTFRNYLQRQVAQIRDKTGCEAVQFRVAAEEGKVKLKAKPVGVAAG